ncbi:MAG: type IV pilus secretin PilQ family protein [Methyloversatilis discipulorum]|uniref:type IV pilus secretin PilQ n=1 Tax=Methyloversatilis discipulorum TaxID=1119528 RepID=UPI0026EAE292|nr:type IV pilus secretin PilQ family protein [Methyloversatilis discipulorum]MBV5287758.1 type IV pilus secretin PilQ family protein [Methyloversatilis discipulorum]
MNFVRKLAGLLCALAVASIPALAVAQAQPNSIESILVSQQGGEVLVKVTTKSELATVPANFSVASPARIAFDFPSTGNALGRSSQTLNEAHLRSFNIVEVGDRTRLVLNLNKLSTFNTRLSGRDLYISLAMPTNAEAVAQSDKTSRFAEPTANEGTQTLRNVGFRRGKDGEGRVVVELSDPNTGIDIRQQGTKLVVEFLRASVADEFLKRYDVTDFGTPITQMEVVRSGANTRLTVTPTGLWEHNAYQSENQFILEVKRLVEDPNKLVQGSKPGYQGEKLSLNFQNIDVRSVLQVIADFTDNNIITSDTVGGSLTLRLKDVPWDQALDIILDAKGLDKRKTGNVIWIAPRDELTAKEKLALESQQQVSELEPLRTETFQLNYHKAEVLYKSILDDKDKRFLSKRGSIVMDTRTNKLIVTDIPSRLEDIRRILIELDVATRQVLIEARIVEANEDFAKNLGARLGINQSAAGSVQLGRAGLNIGGSAAATGFQTGQVQTQPNFLTDSLSTGGLRASNITPRTPGQLSFVLFNSAATRFLNLELSALEQDGKGKVISSPRVMTSDQNEALIEQGVEIPYQQATSSGATSVSFRKANLKLQVKPQITPDGRVQMALDINKDTPNTQLSTGSGVAIDTKHVKTDVLVENGGTVVIGGIYTQDERRTQTRVPFLGDLPYVGFLFRSTETRDNRAELLIFVTPRIVSDNLTLR